MFKFIAKRKLKSIANKKIKNKHAFLDWNNIRTVLVLFETSEYEAIDTFAERLEQAGKTVSGYGFRVKDDNFDYSETNYKIIAPKKDIDKLGVPNNEILNRLNAENYDVVLDLTIKENIPLEFVLASVNATMRVGLKKNKLPLYDISISNLPKANKPESTSAVEELIKSMMYYLQTIKGHT